MRIYLEKFGRRLTSRESGREAALAFQAQGIIPKDDQDVTLDFEAVEVLNPSWADEFISPLLDKYKDRVKFVNVTNPSVKATLEFLASNIWGKKLLMSDHEATRAYKGWNITPVVFENSETGKYLVTVQLRRNNADGSITISSLDIGDLFGSKEEAVRNSYEVAMRTIDAQPGA